jgi:hypothetical protein
MRLNASLTDSSQRMLALGVSSTNALGVDFHHLFFPDLADDNQISKEMKA